jgi:hypothetical protein
MKEIEADRLLDLHSGSLGAICPDVFHPHVAAAPEIAQVLFLVGKQMLEALDRYPVHGLFGAPAQFLS